MSISGTAIAGPSAAFMKSDVASPIAVVRIFVIQKNTVISGTFVSVRVVLSAISSAVVSVVTIVRRASLQTVRVNNGVSCAGAKEMRELSPSARRVAFG